MCLKRVEKKKLQNGCLITLKKYRSSHLKCSKKKLFCLIQNVAKLLRAPILKNIYEGLLLKMCS